MSKESRLAVQKDKYEGKFFKSNRFGDVVVLEYIGNNKVFIKFLDTGYTTTEYLSSIKSGHIRDRSLPTECGVGFIDIEGASIGRNMTPEYSLWNGLLNRCYNKINLSTRPTYKDCVVSENFKYFSKFKEWCNNQVGFKAVDDKGKSFHLDKDILQKNGKMYSEETCCFVPSEINTALVSSKSRRGELPQGVIWNCTKTRYRARIQRGDKWESLGTYDTTEQAFAIYKINKEGHIKSLADKWKGEIDSRVYEALMNWEVCIND